MRITVSNAKVTVLESMELKEVLDYLLRNANGGTSVSIDTDRGLRYGVIGHGRSVRWDGVARRQSREERRVLNAAMSAIFQTIDFVMDPPILTLNGERERITADRIGELFAAEVTAVADGEKRSYVHRTDQAFLIAPSLTTKNVGYIYGLLRHLATGGNG